MQLLLQTIELTRLEAFEEYLPCTDLNPATAIMHGACMRRPPKCVEPSYQAWKKYTQDQPGKVSFQKWMIVILALNSHPKMEYIDGGTKIGCFLRPTSYIVTKELINNQ